MYIPAMSTVILVVNYGNTQMAPQVLFHPGISPTHLLFFADSIVNYYDNYNVSDYFNGISINNTKKKKTTKEKIYKKKLQWALCVPVGNRLRTSQKFL